MIPIKSSEELELLREAGKILAKIMKEIQGFVKEGLSTQEINEFAEKAMLREKVIPAFKGYKGFPFASCTSVNAEIVHGMPSERRLKSGDILSLDLGINHRGYFSDAAITLPIGKVDSRAKKLVEVAKKALSEGIKQARPYKHLYDISHSIQNYVEANGFSIVRQFVGHGIGRSLHEEPEIPNFGRSHEGPILKSGMVFAIEPMVNMGSWESEITDNGWTAVTKDGLPSAHFEHTVAITEKGPEILTN